MNRRKIDHYYTVAARIVVVLMAFALIFDIGMITVHAETDDNLKHIIDNGNYISAERTEDLEIAADRFKEELGVDLIVLTDTSLNGLEPEEYVARFAAKYQLSDFIVFVCIDDEESNYIYNFGEPSRYLAEVDYDTMFDAYDAAETYADGFYEFMAAAADIVRRNQQTSNSDPDAADGENGLPINQGQQIPDRRQKPRLVDDAHLLSDTEFGRIMQRLDKLSEEYWCDIVIVTVNNIGSKSAMEFADDYYDYNGFGYGPDDDGMLFLLSMADRDWWMTTHAYGRYVFSNDGLDYIFAQIKDALSDDNYYKAFNQFIDECEFFLETARTKNEPFDAKAAADAKGRMYTMPIAGALGAFFGGKGMTDGMRRKLQSVKLQPAAINYLTGGAQPLASSYDHLIDRRVNYIPIEKKSSSSSGSSGSHTSSSGRSHGGSGGKF